MIFFMDHCRAIIRTLPTLLHDPHNIEDVDTDSEDHAADSTAMPACRGLSWRGHRPI